MKLKNMIMTALLIALSIIIPVVFGTWLKVIIGPFTATLAAHVPLFMAMHIGAKEAAFVGAGSAIGFLFTSPAVVAARAATHIVVGFVGGTMMSKKVNFVLTMIITSLIHGVLEAIVVLPFGFPLNVAFVTVGIGTILHHGADAVITKILMPKPIKEKLVNLQEAA